jgi:C4-dicarboxylate transporter
VFAASAAATAIGRTTSPAASSASSSATFAHGSSFIYHQRTAQKILAVAGLNGAVRFFVISKFREAKSSRLTCELIANDLD